MLYSRRCRLFHFFFICSPRFANLVGAQINRSVRGHVQLGHTDSVKPLIGTCSLNISYHTLKAALFTHLRYLISLLPTKMNAPCCSFWISCLIYRLESLVLLQHGVKKKIDTRPPDLINPDIEPNNDPFGSPAVCAKAFNKAIELLPKRNTAINLLATTHYNFLPGAIG